MDAFTDYEGEPRDGCLALERALAALPGVEVADAGPNWDRDANGKFLACTCRFRPDKPVETVDALGIITGACQSETFHHEGRDLFLCRPIVTSGEGALWLSISCRASVDSACLLRIAERIAPGTAIATISHAGSAP